MRTIFRQIKKRYSFGNGEGIVQGIFRYDVAMKKEADGQ
jgi:hypothetical protein